MQQEGERATWSKISSIEAHARIGKSIEHCVDLLKPLQVKSQRVEPQTSRTNLPSAQASS